MVANASILHPPTHRVSNGLPVYGGCLQRLETYHKRANHWKQGGWVGVESLHWEPKHSPMQRFYTHPTAPIRIAKSAN
jgi:hypothetical protein